MMFIIDFNTGGVAQILRAKSNQELYLVKLNMKSMMDYTHIAHCTNLGRTAWVPEILKDQISDDQ